MGVVSRVVMEGIEFGMIFGVFSVVVRGGLEDGLGRIFVLELTE